MTLLIEDLAVARGRRRVVSGVSLEIPAGAVTGLLGPNGAGKSSLVLAVGGVVKPASGRVTAAGRDITGRRPERVRRAGVAIVPEGRRLLSDLTVEDNLRVATYSLSRDQVARSRERALEMFPALRERLDQPARSLSGGEQQMLVLAQALISEPRYIVIDELSLGLAPIVLGRLVPAIRRLAEAGIGVLLIEQFAAVALELADGAYIMEGGRIKYAGTAQELKDNPELLRTAYLLGGAAAGDGVAGASADGPTLKQG